MVSNLANNKHFLNTDFDLDDNYQGLFSSAINIGSIVGGLFSAYLSDRLGRKQGKAKLFRKLIYSLNFS